MKTLISIKNQENLIEEKKGFIVGACEDGTIYFSPKKNAYILEVEQNNIQWLQTLQTAFFVAYNKKCRIDKKKSGYFRLSCYSKNIYNDILNARKDFSRVLRKSDDYKIGFLQGVFDAEGSVHNKRLSIRVYSKKKKLISLIGILLEELGIKAGKVHTDKRTNVLMLPIYGKQNLKLFRQKINFAHNKKEYRLKNLLQES